MELQVWQIMIAIIVAAAAFASLRMQAIAHEKLDDIRFLEVSERLREIRADVKKLLEHANGQQQQGYRGGSERG